MQRHRAASRLTSWLFVAALLLKSAVPMLASAAAGLQGRAIAEVCDVYGVDMSRLGARSRPAVAEQADHANHAHHPEHADLADLADLAHLVDHAHHGDQAQHAHHAHRSDADSDALTTPADGAPAHGPASRVAHGGDHCALSALAFALASDAPAVAARPATVAPMPAGGATAAPVVDPAARWAAQLQHAPPASS